MLGLRSMCVFQQEEVCCVYALGMYFSQKMCVGFMLYVCISARRGMLGLRSRYVF